MTRLARHEEIGAGCTIHPSVTFDGVEKLVLGDYVYIGPEVRVVGGTLKVGDYSKIHRGTYIFSRPETGVTLGHCAWIGQGSHLDGTGGISAGDFLGIGINSALYSHIRHGDVTFGCRYEGNSKLVIGNDVWFVGMCLVSPIVAEDRSMALLGSVITKRMDENSIYGGNPARNLTERLGRPWSDTSVFQRANRLKELIDEFISTSDESVDREQFVVCESFPEISDGRTYYNVSTREYTKRGSPAEVRLNRFLFGYRAKFKPRAK